MTIDLKAAVLNMRAEIAERVLMFGCYFGCLLTRSVKETSRSMDETWHFLSPSTVPTPIFVEKAFTKVDRQRGSGTTPKVRVRLLSVQFTVMNKSVKHLNGS
jgi:hypothetical protein